MSIQELRKRTNAGIVECNKALKETNGDIEKAVILLRERGIVKTENWTNRNTKAGTIGSYVHHDGSIAVLVSLKSETDFVSRMPEFKELANNLAMHAAGTGALYVNRSDIPSDMIEKEIAIAKKDLLSYKNDMTEEKISKILSGKMNKFYEQIVLLDQNFVLNDKVKISDMIKEFSGTVKEKVEVAALIRMQVE